MKRLQRWRNGPNLRRTVQVTALVLFFALVLANRRGDGQPGLALQSFFLIDPLLLALGWLAAHAVPAALCISLITLVVTVLMGRVFCGWFCPMGTLNAIAGLFLDYCWPRPKRPERWSPWQLAKYFVLGGVLLMAICGVHTGAILDPIVLLYRSTTTFLFPAAQWALEEGSARSGAGEWGRSMLREHVSEVEHPAFVGGGVIGLLFIATLLLNRYRPRFWCRYICPLGALLGVFALRPLLQRRLDPSSCNQCDLCGLNCHGAAASSGGESWSAAECFGCLNCTTDCRRGSLRWTIEAPLFRPNKVENRPVSAQPTAKRSRRHFLRDVSRIAATVAGATSVAAIARSSRASGGSGNQFLIRPPGSLSESDFLARCTSCSACMRVCPTGCLQPAWGEAGLEGLWTPVLNPRVGRCEYDCTLCGHVCPTGAIAPLTVAEKRSIKIGLAMLDRSRCIPYAYGRDCGTCVEACPFPEKAIRLVDVEVQLNDGKSQMSRVVGQPVVDPDRCTGCGACVTVCPYKDEPAIHVFSANETRNAAARPFLDFGAKPGRADAPSGGSPSADNPYGGS
jgi:MauM/NapG family ferredoxin protein